MLLALTAVQEVRVDGVDRANVDTHRCLRTAVIGCKSLVRQLVTYNSFPTLVSHCHDIVRYPCHFLLIRSVLYVAGIRSERTSTGRSNLGLRSVVRSVGSQYGMVDYYRISE